MGECWAVIVGGVVTESGVVIVGNLVTYVYGNGNSAVSEGLWNVGMECWLLKNVS